jgi:transposase
VAAKAETAIEKGFAGPGLLAFMVTSKFADHLPLHSWRIKAVVFDLADEPVIADAVFPELSKARALQHLQSPLRRSGISRNR